MKTLREFVADILEECDADRREYVLNVNNIRRFALTALAAADAIPDAPVATEHLCSVPCRMLARATPVPSRAELIELIEDAACAATIADLEAGSNWAAMVLDALIKAGAVRP